LQQIGGGNKIALELQIAGEIEPPVGNHIARRQEQSCGHRLYVRLKKHRDAPI
jgi:hypothetical protein